MAVGIDSFVKNKVEYWCSSWSSCSTVPVSMVLLLLVVTGNDESGLFNLTVTTGKLIMVAVLFGIISCYGSLLSSTGTVDLSQLRLRFLRWYSYYVCP